MISVPCGSFASVFPLRGHAAASLTLPCCGSRCALPLLQAIGAEPVLVQQCKAMVHQYLPQASCAPVPGGCVPLPAYAGLWAQVCMTGARTLRRRLGCADVKQTCRVTRAVHSAACGLEPLGC